MVKEERYLKALKIILNNFELHLSPKSKNLKYADYVFVNDIIKEVVGSDESDAVDVNNEKEGTL